MCTPGTSPNHRLERIFDPLAGLALSLGLDRYAARDFVKPDFGATSEDYARHRAGFPDSLFERLAAYGIGRSGQSIVDLGTGTGTLARGFARRGCRVISIDISEAMLQAARGQHGARDSRVGGGGTLALNPSYEERSQSRFGRSCARQIKADRHHRI